MLLLLDVPVHVLAIVVWTKVKMLNVVKKETEMQNKYSQIHNSLGARAEYSNRGKG